MACEEILAQEVILAPGNAQCSYGGLWADGRPLASMTARCLRQFPVDFGCATYVRTVEEPEVEEISERFLRGIGYTGLVEIEFKRDPRDGRYKMLDVNPRTWAWHSLSRRAGIDFPYLAWLQVSDAPVPPARARPGCLDPHGQRHHRAYLEIRRGRLSLAEYVRSLRGPWNSRPWLRTTRSPVAWICHYLPVALSAGPQDEGSMTKTLRELGGQGLLQNVMALWGVQFFRRLCRWSHSLPGTGAGPGRLGISGYVPESGRLHRAANRVRLRALRDAPGGTLRLLPERLAEVVAGVFGSQAALAAGTIAGVLLCATGCRFCGITHAGGFLSVAAIAEDSIPPGTSSEWNVWRGGRTGDLV